MEQKYTFRKLFNDLHLWLGLASGLVLFVVCLSGTIYTFHTEVEEYLEPSKYYVKATPDARPLAPEALVAKLEAELKGKVVSVEIPEDVSRAYRIAVAKAETGEGSREKGKGPEKATERDSRQKGEGRAAKGGGSPGGGGGGGRPTTYFVDPYAGTVLGTTDGPATEFFKTVMHLHRWLLIEGGTGKMIVGVSTIIFVFMILSGLVLWFPVKLRNWKQGLKIKTSAKWKRVNHDLHNTLGFYSFLLLLIMCLTGLCWSFEWYKDGLSAVMGEEVFKGRKEKPLPSGPPDAGALTLTISDFKQRADAILPYAADTRISLPADSAGSVVVTKARTGFFALAAPDKVQLDQYSGKPLKVEIFADKPLNAQLAALIKPLHLGEVFGTFSKILYFIACLIATSLPVTGTIIWINKLKKKPAKKQARKSMAA